MWRAAAGSKATSPSICWLTLACHGFEVAPLKQSRNRRNRQACILSHTFTQSSECVQLFRVYNMAHCSTLARVRTHTHILTYNLGYKFL